MIHTGPQHWLEGVSIFVDIAPTPALSDKRPCLFTQPEQPHHRFAVGVVCRLERCGVEAGGGEVTMAQLRLDLAHLRAGVLPRSRSGMAQAMHLCGSQPLEADIPNRLCRDGCAS